MISVKRGFVVLCLSGLVSFSAPTATFAQMNNQPFSFGSVTGGPILSGAAGMSFAGRQAILNEKLYGSRPHALIVGPSGQLLNVERGPGNIAVVSEPGGAVLPQARGSARAGFAGFGFSVGGGGGGYGDPGLFFPASAHSITGWVAMIDGRLASASGFDSATSAAIDGWTSQVYAN